ncbi:MAG TPA: PH domain-containing protein [Candidatus Saccharimonadales bacterium]|nr:PH domain-containing protein [Candidatus Saccharimonadales bacterium]
MQSQQSPNDTPAQPPPLVGLSKNRKEDLLEPGECILTVVYRSVIGLMGIYLAATVAVAAIVALVIVISPGTFKADGSGLSGSLLAVVFMAAVLLGLILFTATYVYRQSRLLVTDKSLVQITQTTLFIKKVSRLSMSNVEDVNEEQRGILASLFNYGTLTVQTAGTEDNFIFTLCPSPAKLADKIIEARQVYAKKLEEEKNT